MIKEARGLPLRSFSKFFPDTTGARYKCFYANFVKMGEPIVWGIQVPLGGMKDQRTKQKTTDLMIKLATNLQHDCKISCKYFKNADRQVKALDESGDNCCGREDKY